MLSYELIDTSWGPFVVVSTGLGLKASLLPGEWDEPIEAVIARRWPGARKARHVPAELRKAVRSYFRGKTIGFNVPLDLSALTEFRQRVTEAARRIPYGRTASYTDLARAAGHPRASRAAGSTMACNPLPLFVPCHRVLRSDGSLGGFSAPDGSDGLAMKRRLLALEGIGEGPA
ncbi:MAG: methylated-DNA--[protein]-cysteine S-methyltransferase [Phycisphaerae bacterium]